MTGLADIEFAWTPRHGRPRRAGADAGKLTSRGILTLNEAPRAALGREPLADPAANAPMALTATGTCR